MGANGNINDLELAKFIELAGEYGIRVHLLHGDSWLPSVANLAALPATGNNTGDIRQTIDTGSPYRWNGTAWVLWSTSGVSWGGITGTLSAQTDLQAALDAKMGSGAYVLVSRDCLLTNQINLGALTSGILKQTVSAGVATISILTDNSGNWDTAYTHSQATGNPHGTTKTDLGLGNVDNTSDANKPVSTAQQTALNLKQDTSGKDATGGYAGLTLFKINFKNALNTFTSFFTNSNTAARTYTFQDRNGTIADDTDLALKAPLASPTFTGTVGGITKSMVGLGNVDNTSDVNKPVSTAQAAADTAATNAAKAYADSLVVGLLDDRGNHNASSNLWPTTGGSGSAGAILKGDLWTISVAGTLGGHPVTAGDVIRALVDTPGTTDANWAISENNIGYVPENSANKDASGGYAGLTLFKINARNAANTITSFFTNAATVARTWTFPDKDGTVAMTSDITGTNSGTNTGDETLATLGTKQFAATGKTTPVDADSFNIFDSAASNVLKLLTFTNLKAFLKTYFDTLYPSGSGTSSGTNTGDNATNTQYSGLAASKEDVANKSTSITTDQASNTKYPSVKSVYDWATGLFATISNLALKAPIESPTFTGTVTLPTGLTGVLRADAGVVSTDSDVTDLVSAASTTAAGKVELATTAEINTGTDSTRAMPVDQFVSSNRNIRYFDIYAVEKATDNAVGTNIIGSIECPFTGTITEIGAYVETAGVTGTSVWDVNKNGTTIMTTNKLSIDSAEVSTRTAATAPTLTTTAIAAGDLITIDTDSLSTTKPKGLHVRIGIRLT